MRFSGYRGTLGFASGKDLGSSRARSVLSKTQTVDGGSEVVTRAVFVINQVLSGRVPETKMERHYSKKLEALTEPKEIYILRDLKDRAYYEVTKTEYNFALYLLDNEFCTLERVETQINLEMEEEAELHRVSEEKKQAKAQEKARAVQEAKNFTDWLEINKYKYNDRGMLQIAKNIFLNKLNNYHAPSMREFLFCIFGISNEGCRKVVMNRVHIHNKASVKVFECVTGVSLPKTAKGIREVLSSITEANYTSPKTVCLSAKYRGLQEVYSLDKSGWFRIGMGEKCEYNGYTYYLVRTGSVYEIVGTLGVHIASLESKDEAIRHMRLVLSTVKLREQALYDKFVEIESRLEERIGYSTGVL